MESEDILMTDIHDLAIIENVNSFIAHDRNLNSVENNNNHEFQSNISLDAKSKSNHTRGAFVLDTNFIISNLFIVDDLYKLLPGTDIVLVIPYTVFSELDKLKSSSSKSRFIDGNGNKNTQNTKNIQNTQGKLDISVLARRAIDWLYNRLATGSKYIIGQNLSAISNINNTLVDNNSQKKILNNNELRNLIGDDAILDACLFLKNKSNIKTFLLSNDKNFCLKALIHSIPTISYVPDITALKIIQVVITELNNDSSLNFEKSNHSSFNQTIDIEKSKNLIFNHTEKVDKMDIEINTISKPLIALLNEIKTAISMQAAKLVLVHLEIAYPNITQRKYLHATEEYVDNKSLESIAKIINSFWVAYFQNILQFDGTDDADKKVVNSMKELPIKSSSKLTKSLPKLSSSKFNKLSNSTNHGFNTHKPKSKSGEYLTKSANQYKTCLRNIDLLFQRHGLQTNEVALIPNVPERVTIQYEINKWLETWILLIEQLENSLPEDIQLNNKELLLDNTKLWVQMISQYFV